MNYKKSATVIQLSSIVIIATHGALTILHWFFPAAYKAWYQACGVGAVREYDTTLFSVGQRVSGFMMEAIASLLLIYGLLLVIQLMRQIKERSYFTLEAIMLLKRITKVALAYVIYTIICGMALSVIASWQNAPGERVIALTFGSSDMINIMVFCFMLLMLTLVQKGYELKHEQELTI